MPAESYCDFEVSKQALSNLYIASGDFDVTSNQLTASLGPHFFETSVHTIRDLEQ
jgi:hypothetical protein